MNHRTIIQLATFSLAASAAVSIAAPPELRGTWVTTTGLTTGNVVDPATTAANFTRFRNVGLNSVYMDVWRAGATYFPSPSAQPFTGRLMASELGSRDLFAETLIQSHRNQMHQFAWLQYGFAAQFIGATGQPTNTIGLLAKNQNWLLKDSAGNYVNSSNSFAWMNPLVPQVRSLMINMTLDAVKKYDLDGVQFDDRLAWPVQFGYDDVTRAAYLAETGRNLPTNPSDSNFVAWRATKVTDFAREFATAIKTAAPHITVSAAPSVYPFSLTSYCADWPTWSNQTITVNGQTVPMFDEFIPQVYRSTASSFTSEWNSEVAVINQARKGDLAAGISINNGSGVAYDWTTINLPQVNSQRAATGTRGHVWWYSAGVLNPDEAALTAYYNVAATGQALRPDRPASWRRAPVPFTLASGSVWTTTVPQQDRYRIIVKSGSTWSELTSTVLKPGVFSIILSGYAQVELLNDTRGYIPADANFDRRVDLDDFLALLNSFGQSGKLWTQGDFTLDGLVNIADYDLLAQNWGVGVTGPLMALPAMIPEPSTLWLSVATLAMMTQRTRRA